MAQASLDDLDLVLTTMASTIVDNADYFAQLDSIVGDGDFGFSLRNGWEVVLSDYATFDHASAGAILKKVGLTLTSKVGGVSGPDLGHGVPARGRRGGRPDGARSGGRHRDAAGGHHRDHGPGRSVARREDPARRPGAGHRQPRGGDRRSGVRRAITAVAAIQRAADVAVKAAEETKGMLAMRGRAAYTGERSIGSVDAGATAIGVILQAISAAWREKHGR